MALRVLIYDRYAAEYASYVGKTLGSKITVHFTEQASDIPSLIPTCDIFVGHTGGLSTGTFANAHNVKFVQSLWAGVEGWLSSGLPNSVPIARMTSIFGPLIAEYTIGHLLAQCLGVHRLKQDQVEGKWDPFTPETLAGKIMGVAGTGNIGLAVATRASQFDMTVFGLAKHRRTAAELSNTPFQRMFLMSQLPDFLPLLDYLVITLPNTPETKLMFNRQTFALMKKGAWIVNVGRGAVINEDDLVEALESGHLGGAILDVFQTEPLPSTSRLWTLPNVVITPHVAGVTVPSAACKVVAANIANFLEGKLETIPGLVNREEGY